MVGNNKMDSIDIILDSVKQEAEEFLKNNMSLDILDINTHKDVDAKVYSAWQKYKEAKNNLIGI